MLEFCSFNPSYVNGFILLRKKSTDYYKGTVVFGTCPRCAHADGINVLIPRTWATVRQPIAAASFLAAYMPSVLTIPPGKLGVEQAEEKRDAVVGWVSYTTERRRSYTTGTAAKQTHQAAEQADQAAEQADQAQAHQAAAEANQAAARAHQAAEQADKAAAQAHQAIEIEFIAWEDDTASEPKIVFFKERTEKDTHKTVRETVNAETVKDARTAKAPGETVKAGVFVKDGQIVKIIPGKDSQESGGKKPLGEGEGEIVEVHARDFCREQPPEKRKHGVVKRTYWAMKKQLGFLPPAEATDEIVEVIVCRCGHEHDHQPPSGRFGCGYWAYLHLPKGTFKDDNSTH
jgi:hypothetical protein